jgi:phosphomannomutase
MASNDESLTCKPVILEPVDRPMSWGGETWLNSTQPGGQAILPGTDERMTLAGLVEAHPEILGRWARLLFGDRLPIFVKFLRTKFPPFVHMGFCRAVDAGEFLAWLEREQALLRELHAALAIADEPAFDALQEAYQAWAVEEALGRWVAQDGVPREAFAAALHPLLRHPAALDFARWVTEVKANRARIVDVLHEVDLREECGNLLLTQAGTPHAIFGLSHQTHPLDHSKVLLQELFGEFRSLLAAGASEEDLMAAARRADLPSALAKNHAPPKNEAWFPFVSGEEVIIAEPQQTSDVTYSFADFYTPFAWKGRFVFRKGQPLEGLSRADLQSCLASLDFAPTPLEAMRRKAVPIPSAAGSLRAGGFSLVEDPVAWPFFTARVVVLTGSPQGVARWSDGPPAGAFQHVVVIEGSVDLTTEGGETLHLSAARPAFIPATLEGGYRLLSEGPARVLLFSVPVPEDVRPPMARPVIAPGAKPRFLREVPTPLAFGTSGLRGLVKDITDLEAYVNAKGFLRFALKTGDVEPAGTVVVAGDLRPSTGRIMRAVARAVLDAGLRVENAGRIPSPALLYHAMQCGSPSVMVTGSHIPFDRNGIKFNKSTGEVLKSDEVAILKEVAEVRAEEYARSAEETPFDSGGTLGDASIADLPTVADEARQRYIRRYLDIFPSSGLKGKRLVVYEHSAVGRDILVEVLRALGAEVFPEGRSEQFVPIDTENITQEQLDILDALAKDSSGARGPVDAIVSTDGDSDRPLVAAVLGGDEADEKGHAIRFYGGDVVGLVVAEFLKADVAAVPISTNDAVDRRLGDLGVTLAKTRIGSPYVIRAMDDLRAGGYTRCVSWEANGGFLTGTDLPLYGGILKALPTRDAFLPLLCALFAAAQGGASIANLFGRLPKRFRSAGLLDNFPPETSRKMEARLSPSAPEIVEVAFSSHGVRVTDRGGVARALAPTDSLALEMEDKRRFIATHFTSGAGFGPVNAINVLDGVRITFEGGDIAHMRPSGNAPQLRIYANSDTSARADEIVSLCLKEPGGIFRRLEGELGKEQ